MKSRLTTVAFCFALFLLWGEVSVVVAQTERDEGERTGLYGRTITSDTYIVGE